MTTSATLGVPLNQYYPANFQTSPDQNASFFTFFIPESRGFGCSGQPPGCRFFSNAFLIVSLQPVFATGFVISAVSVTFVALVGLVGFVGFAAGAAFFLAVVMMVRSLVASESSASFSTFAEQDKSDGRRCR